MQRSASPNLTSPHDAKTSKARIQGKRYPKRQQARLEREVTLFTAPDRSDLGERTVDLVDLIQSRPNATIGRRVTPYAHVRRITSTFDHRSAVATLRATRDSKWVFLDAKVARGRQIDCDNLTYVGRRARSKVDEAILIGHRDLCLDLIARDQNDIKYIYRVCVGLVYVAPHARKRGLMRYLVTALAEDVRDDLIDLVRVLGERGATGRFVIALDSEAYSDGGAAVLRDIGAAFDYAMHQALDAALGMHFLTYQGVEVEWST